MNTQEIQLKLLKKLFFTRLTSEELKIVLEVTDDEYYNLLTKAKQELGLAENYYRTPQSYNQYNKKAYLIELTLDDETIINGYYNDYDVALGLKKEYETGNKYRIINIIQATDENMIKLLYKDYPNHDTPSLMKKYQLPYQQYYRLLKKLKETYNITESRTRADSRYIYKYDDKYQLKKKVDKTQYYFGVYDNFETAKRVRDYLETHNWNIQEWEDNKETILEEIGVEPPSH